MSKARPIAKRRPASSAGALARRARLPKPPKPAPRPARAAAPAPISLDYAKLCFVIMPFGTKPVGKHKVNFDRIYETIFEPAINEVDLPEGGRLIARRADRDFISGD